MKVRVRIVPRVGVRVRYFVVSVRVRIVPKVGVRVRVRVKVIVRVTVRIVLRVGATIVPRVGVTITITSLGSDLGLHLELELGVTVRS